MPLGQLPDQQDQLVALQVLRGRPEGQQERPEVAVVPPGQQARPEAVVAPPVQQARPEVVVVPGQPVLEVLAQLEVQVPGQLVWLNVRPRPVLQPLVVALPGALVVQAERPEVPVERPGVPVVPLEQPVPEVPDQLVVQVALLVDRVLEPPDWLSVKPRLALRLPEVPALQQALVALRGLALGPAVVEPVAVGPRGLPYLGLVHQEPEAREPRPVVPPLVVDKLKANRLILHISLYGHKDHLNTLASPVFALLLSTLYTSTLFYRPALDSCQIL